MTTHSAVAPSTRRRPATGRAGRPLVAAFASVPTSDWFDVMGRTTGRRVVRGDANGWPLLPGSVVAVDYAPFDRVIEVVTDSGGVRTRWWIDRPMDVAVAAAARRCGRLLIRGSDTVVDLFVDAPAATLWPRHPRA